MKKLIFVCCIAALFVACKSTTTTTTTSTPNTKTETTTTTTKTETTKPEEAAHNYYMIRGTGSHYISGDTVYNEFLIEMYPDMLEVYRVTDTIKTNTDYMITFDDNGTTDYTDDVIITFAEV